MNLRFALTTALVVATATTAVACGAGASKPAGTLPVTPVITTQRSTLTNLEHRWGEINRWHIEGADWSIDLPEQGRWDFGGPLSEAGFSPDTAIYRSDNGTVEAPDPFIFVDVLRFDLSALATSSCVRPTILDPDGGLISVHMDDLRMAGRTAMVSRITSPGRDGSATGTFEICFVTGDSMYQLTAAALPQSAQSDLFAMLGTFTLNN